MFSDETPYEKIWLVHDVEALSFIQGNRDIDTPQVRSAKNWFKQGKYIAPVYVTKDGKIVDGQHRFTAFVQLCNEGHKHFFLRIVVIDSEEDPLDLAIQFNACRKNWSTKDYMKAYTTAERDGYMKLQELKDAYPAIDTKAGIQLLKGSHSTATFKSGALSVTEDELCDAMSKAGVLQQLACDTNIGRIVFRRGMILAFYRIFHLITDMDQFIENSKKFIMPETEKISDWVDAYKRILP